MAKYKDLQDLRYQNGRMSQREMARKIGMSECGYSLIERGKRAGSRKVWLKIQTIFNLKDEDIWKLQKQNQSKMLAKQ